MPVHLYDDRHFATVPSGDEPRLMVLCAFPHRLIYQKLWIVAKCQHAKMGGGITLLCMVLSIVSVVCVVYFDMRLGKDTPPYKYVSPSGIWAVLTSVSSLMYFKDLKIKNSRFINMIAASTFGVLLIHDNSAVMRLWLWQEIFHIKSIYTLDLATAVFMMILTILAVFIICILFDMLRKNTIEKWILNQINKKL